MRAFEAAGPSTPVGKVPALRYASGRMDLPAPTELAQTHEMLFGWIRSELRRQLGPLGADDVHPGAVSFIQRFGDALDLNPHVHALVLDGAYVFRHGRLQGFVRVEPPSDEAVAQLTEQVARRVERMLRRRGKLDDGQVGAVEDDGSVLLPCMLASVQRVDALGATAGRALARPGRHEVERVHIAKRRCAELEGFSLHADVCVPARDRAQLERLCRYVARPAIASERLELLPDGRLRYRFKRPWRDGSVAVEYDPVDFIGKLAALVPRPRTNLVRYHGCLAAHSSIRAYAVKDGRGPPPSAAELERTAITASEPTAELPSRAAISCKPMRERSATRPARLRWDQLMRRVFDIDVLACPSCGARMRPIAEITDRRLAKKMLEHVGLASEVPACCAGPRSARVRRPAEPGVDRRRATLIARARSHERHHQRGRTVDRDGAAVPDDRRSPIAIATSRRPAHDWRARPRPPTPAVGQTTAADPHPNAENRSYDNRASPAAARQALHPGYPPAASARSRVAAFARSSRCSSGRSWSSPSC